MKFITLTDKSTIEIKVNMKTIQMLSSKEFEVINNKDATKEEQMNIVAGLLYAIIYSNGRKISKDDALMLIPIDESDAFFDLIEEFKIQVSNFQKKMESRASLMGITS